MSCGESLSFASASPARPEVSEAERLAVLASYRILDTGPEPAFDELAALSAEICQAPICLISLSDAERHWFKARLGLEITQTPREAAFCEHTFQQRAFVEINDASQEPRFAAHPQVTGPSGIRFYAGVPLIDGEGHVLGTLCVMDRLARHLSPLQRRTLEVLSHQVVQLLELRRANAWKTREMELIERTRRCQNELNALGSDESLSLEAQLAGALDILTVYADVDAAGLYEVLGDQLKIMALRCKPPYESALAGTAGDLFPFAGTNAERVFAHDGVWAWQDLDPDDPLPGRTTAAYQVTDLFGVAYPIDGQPAGVLICHRYRPEPEPLHPLQREFLHMFATWIAARIERHRHRARERDWNEIHLLALSGSRAGLLVIPDLGGDEMIWSEQTYALFGYAEGQLQMRRSLLAELIHPDDRLPASLILQEAQLTGQPFTVEFRVRHAAGQEVWVRLNASFSREAKGPERLVGVVSDITAEKAMDQALRASEERARRILEVSPVPMLVFELGGAFAEIGKHRLLHANSAFTQLFGYTREDLGDLMHLLTLLYPDPDYRQEVVSQNLAQHDGLGKEAPVSLSPTWVTASDGQRRLTERLMSRSEKHVILAFYDLTERHLMENELRDNSRRLAELNDRLAAINAEKDRLLGIVAHDLRNPISAIATAQGMLRGRAARGETPSAKLLDVIEQACLAAENLIADLLELAELEQAAPSFSLERVSGRAFVESISDSFQSQAEARGIRLALSQADEDLPLKLDSLKMSRALGNLLQNALKFTPAGGTVSLTLSRTDEGAAILVEDDGIGIPEAFQQIIFDKFTQARRPGLAGEKAHGLGMHITREIIRKHGGEIRVSSQPGKGARFEITLPVSPD